MQLKTIKLKLIPVALLSIGVVQAAHANNYLQDQANVYITGNLDSNPIGATNPTEGVYIQSNGATAPLQASVNVLSDGTITMNALASTTINSTTNVNGTANVNGVTNINTAASNSNATNINTNGTGTVTIGNAASSTVIQGGNNTVSGNNLITGTNTVTGVTSINDSANYATSINTGSSTGAVTVGNSANATSLNSAINNIGVVGSAYATVNTIGNTNTRSTVTAVAGNATQALANNSAITSVSGGTSQLSGATASTSGQVAVSNGGGVSVSNTGMLGASGATAPTVGMTLTNGNGQVNGVAVTETQSVISGGTSNTAASSLSLNNNGARFSNVYTGGPVTVTGVADGSAPFDAVNVRQFAGAIAAVTAQANIPSLSAGQTHTVGVGVGNFMGHTGLALGINMRAGANGVVRASVSSGMNGGASTAVGVGASWSW